MTYSSFCYEQNTIIFVCDSVKKKTNKTKVKMQIMEDKIGNGPEWISVVNRSAYSRLVCFILTVIPFVSQKRRTKKGGGKWEKNTKT